MCLTMLSKILWYGDLEMLLGENVFVYCCIIRELSLAIGQEV